MMKHSDFKSSDILLVLLPYWDPMVPPQGITQLKYFLRLHGFRVTVKDANTQESFKELHDRYFAKLKTFVPEHKKGNFINIGHDVLREHMMAHLNASGKKGYFTLLKQVIYLTYYTHCSDFQMLELDHILDEFYSRLNHYCLNLLAEVKPAVLGISVLRDTLAPSLFMFKLAKQVNPSILTVMGGNIFAQILTKDTPNFHSFVNQTPYIDKLIIGEGQVLLLKLLNGELPQSQRVFTLKDVGGEIVGVSELARPDMSNLDVTRDYPYLPAQSSVSCPFLCSFCNERDFLGPYRKMNPREAVNEMIALHKEYGGQLFFMSDSLLNYTVANLARAVGQSGVMLYWDGYIRVSADVCNPENTLLWRRGGFYRARLGIESGSPRLLKIMNKQISVEHIKAAICSLAAAGIKTTTYWVIGHPGESEHDFQHTLDLLSELKHYIYEAECNPFTYRYAGPGMNDIWSDKRMLLYPPGSEDMLMLNTWLVNDEPSREETYKRICRFVQHCHKEGIPNPYSIFDIYKADERWQKLQPNAVPAFVRFKDKEVYIDDKETVNVYAGIETVWQDEGDFGF